MKTKIFLLIAGIIFAVVAILHLLRLINGAVVLIDDWEVPMSISWGGTIVAAILSIYAFRLRSA